MSENNGDSPLSEQLGPCLRCLKDVRLENTSGGRKIICMHCGLQSPYFHMTTDNEVIEWWNARPGEDALNAEIAGLKKKLEMTQMLLKDMTEIHAENCNELECVNILAVKKFTEETDAE